MGEADPVVNNFQIIIATVNGTGSQTANTVLLRALFKMGIPVSGKNIFPSNIQGLPTWFTIRVNKDGYIARCEVSEVLVAMNQASIEEDIEQLPPGGVCIYPEEWHIKEARQDVVYYAVPVKGLIKDVDIPRNLQDYIANMVYVGVLAVLLGMELDEIQEVLNFHFAGKGGPVNLNMGVVRTAAQWAQENLVKIDPYRVERMDKTGGKILHDGNATAALGAVFGGVSFVAWYPITPATSLMDALGEYLKELRHDPETGLATYVVVQAEDELSAIGMLIGAGWAGARAMTSTSGPGMSLMAEYSGLAYFAEVPAVVWNVQRVGPSTGLPTRTSQGDVLSAYLLGHGDTKHPVLLPGSLEECFEFGWKSFDIAERLQTLVFVLSDLDLGMNLWMSESFAYPDRPMDRGKVLTADELEQIENWGRFVDVDGDGIAYRTLPGTDHPRAAYFARGTGHNERAIYSERPEDWAANFERLNRKWETARTVMPEPVLRKDSTAQFGMISYGTCDPAVQEAHDRLAAEGIHFDYLRLRALPIGKTAESFLAAHDRVYVFENNSDGQVAKIIRMEFPQHASKIVSLAYLDGLPPTAYRVAEMVRSDLAREKEK